MKRMRRVFPGYYRPTKEEFSKLWDSCLFVFDTSTLLNIYRYELKTRNELIKTLREISEMDRLWIPHQVVLEYHENRSKVIQRLKKPYESMIRDIDKVQASICGHIETYKSHHNINHVDELIDEINQKFKHIKDILDNCEKEHPNWSEDDEIQTAIEDIFDGKIGDPYAQKTLEEIYRRGEIRYNLEIPPGYMDSKGKKAKVDYKKYGDLVIWFQLMDKAKETHKPIILITNDDKDDWWLRSNSEIIGPRHELIQEFNSETNQSFYMYSADRFLGLVKEHLNIEIEQEIIEEIRNVRSLDEYNENISTIADGLIRTITQIDPAYSSIAKAMANYESASTSVAKAMANYEPVSTSIAKAMANYEPVSASIAKAMANYEPVSTSIARAMANYESACERIIVNPKVKNAYNLIKEDDSDLCSEETEK